MKTFSNFNDPNLEKAYRNGVSNERRRIVRKMLKIEKEKWKDAIHCTCLAYAIVSIFGERYEKIIKKFKKEI